MGLGHSGENSCGDWHIQGLCVVRPAISHHTRSVSSSFLSLHKRSNIVIDIIIR